MLIRLILAPMLVLVLALGAMPVSAGAAACHGDPTMAAMPAATMPAQHRRHDHPATAEHGCIGCAALADWLAERVAASAAVRVMAPRASLARLALRAAAPPRERPPRLG